MRVVPGPGTGSEWYRLQTTTPQPRGGMVLLGVGQGQGVLLLQTTTFPEAPRQVNRCALTDYYLPSPVYKTAGQVTVGDRILPLQSYNYASVDR